MQTATPRPRSLLRSDAVQRLLAFSALLVDHRRVLAALAVLRDDGQRDRHPHRDGGQRHPRDRGDVRHHQRRHRPVDRDGDDPVGGDDRCVRDQHGPAAAASAIVGGVLTGGLMGLLNGVLIARFRHPAVHRDPGHDAGGPRPRARPVAAEADLLQRHARVHLDGAMGSVIQLGGVVPGLGHPEPRARRSSVPRSSRRSCCGRTILGRVHVRDRQQRGGDASVRRPGRALEGRRSTS